MDELMSEHGGIIVSGIVSLISLTIIFTVMYFVGNMDSYSISALIGG